MRLSPPVSRLVAVSLLLLIPAGLYTLVLTPLWAQYRALSAQAAQLHAIVGRGAAIERERQDLTARIAEQKRNPDATGEFLRGESSAAIGADLEVGLKKRIDALHGALNSTQILPPAEKERFRRIGVRVQMAIDPAGLQHLIYDLESSTPLLFIDNLRIQAPNPGQSQPGPLTARPPAGSATPPAEDRLNVLFDVYGYAAARSP